VASGALTPAAYKKIKKPYEDMLYTLGVKECDAYLPTDDEVLEMIQQSQAATKNKQPSPAEQKDLSQAQLNTVKGSQIDAEVAGNTASQQLEGYALIAQNKARAYAP
jgi:K+-transporting ATPase c subunit